MSRKKFEDWYVKSYLGCFPNDFLSWLEDFVKQIDVPYPDKCDDIYEMQRRIGAWETQMIIAKKLKYAIKEERERLSNDNKSSRSI